MTNLISINDQIDLKQPVLLYEIYYNLLYILGKCTFQIRMCIIIALCIYKHATLFHTQINHQLSKCMYCTM